MKKHNILRVSILLLFIFIIFSCKKYDKQKISNNDKLVNVRIKVDFPTTAKVGDSVKGIIKYWSDYDTVKSNLVDHYVYLVLDSIYDSEKNNKYHYPTIIKKDTFGLIYDSIIPIYDITFKNLGTFSLSGRIIDEIFLDINDPNSEAALKKSTVTTQIIHELKVEDKD
jgi:hypothetical protein